MQYELLKQIIDELEEFQSGKPDSHMTLDSFRVHLNEKSYQREAPQHLMHKMNVQTPELDNEICKQILMLGRYAKLILKKAMDNFPELVNEDFTYLYRLLDYESLTKMQLIEKNAHEKQSGLEIIKRLIKFDLVREFQDPHDGRSKRISVTEKGKKLFKDSIGEVSEVSQILTARLETTEKESLLNLFKKLNLFHHDVYLTHRDESIAEIKSLTE